jgi:RNA polymerase sigma factor (sigma-70 family)
VADGVSPDCVDHVYLSRLRLAAVVRMLCAVPANPPPEPESMDESEPGAGAPPRRRGFPTTHWSVVCAAGQAAVPEARDALDRLCVTYWSPVYAFVRRTGRSTDDARDLTQAFFARIIEKGDFRNARQERGRFRNFLLTAVRHFLSNQADYEHAAKRGGGTFHVPLDRSRGEDVPRVPEPSSGETPETTYERHWALTVLETSMARLEQECDEAGNRLLFETLRPFLTGEDAASYAEAARVLQKAEGTVRVAVHRMRRQFGRCLRDTLADTVAEPADVDAELAYLLEVVGRRHGESSLKRP